MMNHTSQDFSTSGSRSHPRSPSHSRVHHPRSGLVSIVVLLATLLFAAGCAGTSPTGPITETAGDGGSGEYTLSASGDPAGSVGSETESTTAVSEPTDPPITATSGAPTPKVDESLDTDGDQPPAEFPTGITPAHISIPAIGVDAPVIDLDLRGAEPEVPENFADTGWYEQTRLPGEIGPSVIAGHVDSVDGPAVFARLSLLQSGDEIVVTSAGGESRSFVVVDSGQYPKTDLPDEVFGFGEPVPELRLITCGGTFDRSVRHYIDNFVVYAVSNSQSPSAL